MARNTTKRVRGAAAALLAAALSAGPAHAGLVNTYGSTDDVWGSPLGHGHGLLDVRLSHTALPQPQSLLTASFAYGLGAGTEVGVWSGYGMTGLGTAQTSSAPSVLNPYLKVLAPWTLGSTSFGLVAGAQIPTQSGQDPNVAAEGVAILPISEALSLDLNLGVGRALVSSATLGHTGASLYYSLPNQLGLVGEVFTLVSSAADPSFGQHLALTLPLGSGISGDVGVAVNESMSGAVTAVTPHAGATLTW